jgi:hypothetical protein
MTLSLLVVLLFSLNLVQLLLLFYISTEEYLQAAEHPVTMNKAIFNPYFSPSSVFKSNLAASSEEPGFWPVISKPSCCT